MIILIHNLLQYSYNEHSIFDMQSSKLYMGHGTLAITFATNHCDFALMCQKMLPCIAIVGT